MHPSSLPSLSSYRRPIRAGAASGKSALLLLAIVSGMMLFAVAVGSGVGVVRERLVTRGLDEAAEGLLTMQARMASHRRQHGTYATAGSALSPCEAPLRERSFGHFVIRCAEPPGTATYTLVAVGSDALAGFALSVDQGNRRATVGVPQGWPACPSAWANRDHKGC